MEPKTLILITIIIVITTPLPSLSSQVSSNKTPTTATAISSSLYKALITRNAIQQQFLRTHNALRAKLHLPPLKWSNYLAQYATRWAKARRGDCNLIHSGGPYGENLFWGSGKGWTARDAVVGWASERAYYDRWTHRCTANGDCLHYTQLVWRKSSRIGCALSYCNTGDTFIICNYDPPGNIIGQPPF